MLVYYGYVYLHMGSLSIPIFRAQRAGLGVFRLLGAHRCCDVIYVTILHLLHKYILVWLPHATSTSVAYIESILSWIIYLSYYIVYIYYYILTVACESLVRRHRSYIDILNPCGEELHHVNNSNIMLYIQMYSIFDIIESVHHGLFLYYFCTFAWACRST